MAYMKPMSALSLKYEDGRLLILDQQRLPHDEIWIECYTPKEMIECIRALKVRGAPLIGVAAALSVAQTAEAGASRERIRSEACALREARPTAVNLMVAMDRILGADDVVAEAERIFDEDVALCNAIASHGETLIQDGDRVLTHCNTGGLATAGVGTALGVLRKAQENGKLIHVYVDETRPLLQGARLTAWELDKLNIPYTLICDNMAAMLMQQGKVNKVIVGADRIAANGDFANKVGTYSLAVNAHFHRIPFYVAAPWTTIDPQCQDGGRIPIEERDADEVRAGKSPAGCPVFNPAFDVTPVALVSSYILDRGVFSNSSVQELIRRGR